MPWSAAKLAQKRANSAKVAGHPDKLSGKQKAVQLKQQRADARAVAAAHLECGPCDDQDQGGAQAALERIARWRDAHAPSAQDMPAPPAASELKDAALADAFDGLMQHLRGVEVGLLSGRAGDDGWPAGREAWAAWLAALSTEALEACEKRGLHNALTADALASAAATMPPDLRGVCAAVAEASAAFGRFDPVGTGAAACSCTWRQSAEKAEQVRALLAAVRARADLRGVRRVVDVGCGKGHLTAALRRALGVPAIGVDVDEAVVLAARALYPEATFEVRDVTARGLECREGDLVVGLHPCGALGEALTTAVAAHGGAMLVMVPCCWHKQRAAVRTPLSAAGTAAALSLPPTALKKACMALDGSSSLASRRTRHELRELLRRRGVEATELTPHY